ncbi:glutathione-s-transferase theta, gst, putative [Ricinus communis]|uniref:glutathione transferase n=1 Tax=Ricinus communis TaxID=3988 RepID=B9RCA3_RICCO|nr:glutathione-s-transferase theta, gst, putative [Ricinus communis]
MELKLYVHRLSEPSRALIAFCKLNGIEFEEIEIDLVKGQHKSPEFKVITETEYHASKFEKLYHRTMYCHAILGYLASAFPGVADHWYPADLQKRAKVHAVLDWHHSNLRRGSVMYVLNTKLGPVLGLPVNPQAAAEGEKVLSCSLETIESVWLNDGGPFLIGGDQPSIADLSLVCQIMQLEVLDENDRNRFLGPHKKVQQWIENIKKATSSHFDEVHDTLYKFSAMLKQKSAEGKSEA